MNDISPATNIGIAARYAAQIRELLALRTAGVEMRQTGEANKPLNENAGSDLPSRPGAWLDLRI